MKKVVIAVALLCLLVSIAGCGDKEPKNTTLVEPDGTEAVIKNTDGSANAETNEPEKTSGEALCGVYLNGGSAADVKLGIYFEGAQKYYCTVKMPETYMLGALFQDENGEDIFLDEIADDSLIYEMGGDETLKEILEQGSLEETEYPITCVTLSSLGEDRTKVGFYLCNLATGTMEDEKNLTPDRTDFGTEAHPAYYYQQEDAYMAADLYVVYQVNDSVLLRVTYSGPLADELGLEQLAQNIYDLVEVIN